LDEYVSKLGVLSLLSAEFFIEVRKKTEEELNNAFGKEVGQFLWAEANCEDRFPQVNQKMSQQMEPLDSDEFDARERRDARQNAFEIKNNILKLVRIFSRKQMQDKLNKEFNIPK